MFDIVYYGNPILRKMAKPVKLFDNELKNFVNEMSETMFERDGVGLAAPQVGKSIRVIVIDTTKGASLPMVLINPAFVYKSKEVEEKEEGCLSLPEIHVNIKRPAIVSVKAYDVNGKEFTINNAEGLLARALQHEIDHLDGLLIIDHISHLQRKMLSSKLKKISSLNNSKKSQYLTTK